MKTRDSDDRSARIESSDAGPRVALRARIAEEVARQGGHPLAQRTLLLLTEAAVDPQDAAPGYRILDRTGLPRRMADPAPTADGRTVETVPDRPMTLADFVTELRERHPALFVPPVPEELVPATVVTRVAAEEIPAAGPRTDATAGRSAAARLVETQAVFARTALTRSATRGRALAASASGGWRGLRQRFEARPTTSPPDAAAAPNDAPSRSGGFAPMLSDVAGQARGRLADAGARLRGAGREGGMVRNLLDRRILATGAGLLGLVAVVALVSRSGEETSPPSAPPAMPPRSEAVAPPVAPETAARVDEGAKGADEGAKVADERAANALSGPVEVIDTATLRVAGKLVRLFGVEWVRGGQADELTRYLAGRTVTCQPVAGSEARLCNVDGRDLSEVVLFNGGGRASSEATPDLVAAEDRARSERLGVWAR
ncbi:hypothetical protein [Methylobacterium sp. J-090]|uniref:hypothetical protein n=1 Tax=Methylobacterium sp. J-090 TaxID=2836666 RepID=UPI001FBA3602|nr:hypothetical protein [Methylobacterium sp. J-090]MCJ2084347.1 hypothetical protein [Methylobacterium sp. J-090]